MKIEKGIPMAAKALGRPKGTKLANWHKMEIGDSVLMGKPGDKTGKFSSSQSNAQRLTGWKFESRAVPEGVRIWRTA